MEPKSSVTSKIFWVFLDIYLINFAKSNIFCFVSFRKILSIQKTFANCWQLPSPNFVQNPTGRKLPKILPDCTRETLWNMFHRCHKLDWHEMEWNKKKSTECGNLPGGIPRSRLNLTKDKIRRSGLRNIGSASWIHLGESISSQMRWVSALSRDSSQSVHNGLSRRGVLTQEWKLFCFFTI